MYLLLGREAFGCWSALDQAIKAHKKASRMKSDQTEKRPGWLRRQLQRRGTGDTVAAQIGAGARTIAVGKNIVQIGSIVIPLWAIIIICASLLLIAARPTVKTVARLIMPPKMPGGAYNIAVAEFTHVGDANARVGRQTARELSQSIAAFIEQQAGELAAMMNQGVVEVWGDQERVSPITADSRLEKHRASLNAAVLLYGTLESKEDGEWLVKPAFYLADEAVHQADELIGEHVLGTEIPIEPDNLASEGDLNREMRARESIAPNPHGSVEVSIRRLSQCRTPFRASRQRSRVGRSRRTQGPGSPVPLPGQCLPEECITGP